MNTPAEPVDNGTIAVLRAWDARVTGLIAALARTARRRDRIAARERLVRMICSALSVQHAVEQEILHPSALRDYPKLAFAFQLAAQGFEMRIAEIRNPARSETQRDAAVVRLIAMVRRNLLERRHVLFPAVERGLSSSRAHAVAAALVQRSAELRNGGLPPEAAYRATAMRAEAGSRARTARSMS